MMRKILLAVIFMAGLCQAQEMKYEEYLAALKEAREREQAALPKIAKLKTQIAAIKLEIEGVQKQTEKVWEEILALVGITQAEYDEFVNQLVDLQSEIQNFESTYANDFKGWAAALKKAEKRLAELRKNKIAVIPRLEEHFNGIEQALVDSRQALDMAKSSYTPSSSGLDSYTVQLVPGNRDCLWRIAEKPEIYGDAARWSEIYRANSSRINNPDLIFPGQVLTIPR